MMLLNTWSTMTSECFLVRSDTRDTSSTSSALVMLPPGVFNDGSLPRFQVSGSGLVQVSGLVPGPRLTPESRYLPISKVIAEGRRPRPFVVGVRLPVRAVVVRLQRADAESDLPFLWAQLDDLHLVVVAHLQVDLLAAVRVV